MAPQPSPSDEAAIELALVDAAARGEFLVEVARSRRSARDVTARLLVKIHNAGQVDVVAEYLRLENNVQGPDFFLTRQAFEEALPDLAAPVAQVMRCTMRLSQQAGQDLLARSVFSRFSAFCDKDPSRIAEGLEIAEADPNSFADLIYSLLLSGSKIDLQAFGQETLRLAEHPDPRVRHAALSALGTLVGFEPTLALAALAAAVLKEDNESTLGAVIVSALNLGAKIKTSDDRDKVLSILADAMDKGGLLGLFAASQGLMFNVEALIGQPAIIDFVLDRLSQTPEDNNATLQQIDLLLQALVTQSQHDSVISFLERLLPTSEIERLFQKLQSTVHAIQSDHQLLQRIATRFLASGDAHLGRACAELTSQIMENNVRLAVDASELVSTSDSDVIFLARKAMGHLFPTPITAAWFVISLMECASDGAIGSLAELLFNPLFLSHPRLAKELLSEGRTIWSKRVVKVLRAVSGRVDEYLTALGSPGTCPELQPSLRHVEAHNRHEARKMAAMFKEAQARSVFMSLAKRSVLLYGRKSIVLTRDPFAQLHRTEIQMGSHGVTIEYPRLQRLDPTALNYQLFMFRAERRPS